MVDSRRSGGDPAAMPELPDVTVYVESLRRCLQGRRIEAMEVRSPFFVRTFDPPWRDAIGRRLTGVHRLGKRIVLETEGELFLVVHLMIAGRMRLRPVDAKTGARSTLAVLQFEPGILHLTEAGSKKRASLHVVHGEAGLTAHDPGGLDVLSSSGAAFAKALGRRRHTLKRALTDPSILDGIGNAYSDEILHAARLSPLRRTDQLAPEEVERLHKATQEVLTLWIDRTREEVGDGFPDKVTAFRKGMAVHGRYGEPCPECGAPVQRIAYADTETNYCAACQTGGNLLADRVLSRLLKEDWPRSLEELEAKRRDPEHE